jgi:hypothetical protein
MSIREWKKKNPYRENDPFYKNQEMGREKDICVTTSRIILQALCTRDEYRKFYWSPSTTLGQSLPEDWTIKMESFRAFLAEKYFIYSAFQN